MAELPQASRPQGSHGTLLCGRPHSQRKGSVAEHKLNFKITSSLKMVLEIDFSYINFNPCAYWYKIKHDAT